MIRRIPLGVVCAAALALAAGRAQAVVTTIDFEGYASSGEGVNVSPTTPYNEDGFTLTPTDNQSAVFDALSPNQMLGNPSDWFGFGESNTPRLTLTAGTDAFDLIDILIGPSTIAGALPIEMTITGHIVGGGTVSSNFTNLRTATTVTLDFHNLKRVDFVASDDAALDNIRVQVVPEPSSLAVITGSAWLMGMRARRRRR